MKRAIGITAVFAALAAGSALADDRGPTSGSERDPFSQTYTGQKADAPEPAPIGSHACARSCDCGHHAEKQAPSKS